MPTITGTVTEFEWEQSTPPRLRIYAKVPFIAGDGMPILSGGPHGGWAYVDVACTLDGENRVVVPDVIVPYTEDSLDKPADAMYTAFLFSRGADLSSQYQEFSVFGGGFRVPLGGDPLTWEDIALNMGPSGASAVADRTVNNLTVQEDASVAGDLSVAGSVTANSYVGIEAADIPTLPQSKVTGLVSDLAGKRSAALDTVDTFNGREGTVVLTSADLNGLSGAGLTGIGVGVSTGHSAAGSVEISADTDEDGLGVVALKTRNLNRLVVNNDGSVVVGGAFTAPVRDKGGQVFNVKAYGAVGDGVTNDRVAIQQAIDAAVAAGGGRVFFPPGIYYIASGLTVPHNKGIEFDGRASTLYTDQAITILESMPADNTEAAAAVERRPKITGMIFQGTAIAGQQAIKWGGSYMAEIVGNRFVNFETCVEMIFALKAFIAGNRIEGYTSRGLVVRTGTSADWTGANTANSSSNVPTIADNRLYGGASSDIGILVAGSGGYMIANNVIEGAPSTVSIYIDSAGELDAEYFNTNAKVGFIVNTWPESNAPDTIIKLATVGETTTIDGLFQTYAGRVIDAAGCSDDSVVHLRNIPSYLGGTAPFKSNTTGGGLMTWLVEPSVLLGQNPSSGTFWDAGVAPVHLVAHRFQADGYNFILKSDVINVFRNQVNVKRSETFPNITQPNKNHLLFENPDDVSGTINVPFSFNSTAKSGLQAEAGGNLNLFGSGTNGVKFYSSTAAPADANHMAGLSGSGLLIGGSFVENAGEKLDVRGNAKVTGNFESTTASNGVILKSPDGTRFKLTVSNAGALVITAL